MAEAVRKMEEVHPEHVGGCGSGRTGKETTGGEGSDHWTSDFKRKQTGVPHIGGQSGKLTKFHSSGDGSRRKRGDQGRHDGVQGDGSDGWVQEADKGGGDRWMSVEYQNEWQWTWRGKEPSPTTRNWTSENGSHHTWVRKKLVMILVKFVKVFAKGNDSLGICNMAEHDIPLVPNAKPVYQSLGSSAYKEQLIPWDLVAKMKARGAIKVSFVPWGARLLLVQKKDWTWQFCVEYIESFIHLW